MVAALGRPADCLAQVLVDEVVSDPESIRSMARANGPYSMPARYLIDGQPGDGARRNRFDVPDHLIGPTWPGDWAVDGRPLVRDSEALLHHEGFISPKPPLGPSRGC